MPTVHSESLSYLQGSDRDGRRLEFGRAGHAPELANDPENAILIGWVSVAQPTILQRFTW